MDPIEYDAQIDRLSTALEMARQRERLDAKVIESLHDAVQKLREEVAHLTLKTETETETTLAGLDDALFSDDNEDD